MFINIYLSLKYIENNKKEIYEIINEIKINIQSVKFLIIYKINIQIIYI